MVEIKAFKGTRPYNEDAEKLIAPSTDHLSEEGIIDIHEKNYWNYLKVLNPVGQLKNEDSLRIAKEHFNKMKEQHIIKQDEKECFYLYRIQSELHIQTGFLSVTKINNYINNLIKGHELIYENRMKERADQMLNLETQIGPIYVSYKDNAELDDFINELTISLVPKYDFKAFDDSQHTLWTIEDEKNINKIVYLSEHIDFFYIADGHHRMGALNKLLNYKLSKNSNHLGTEGYNYFMIAAFPKSQSKIYDYNRVIKDLNGLTVEQFLTKIKINFDCEYSSKAVKPSCSREYGMYHNNNWYVLKFKNEEILEDNILSKLDINIIDKFCLKPILGINDASKDERIRYIAGCHGLKALEKKVDDNPNSVAFSIFPTKIDDVIDVADLNLTMPPKTTWFDPKPLDGLVVYEFKQ